jgi:hypothetical protein
LTTTQRMKEFRTAHSESVVKEREHDTSRPKQKNPTRLRSFGAAQGTLRASSGGWWR